MKRRCTLIASRQTSIFTTRLSVLLEHCILVYSICMPHTCEIPFRTVTFATLLNKLNGVGFYEFLPRSLIRCVTLWNISIIFSVRITIFMHHLWMSLCLFQVNEIGALTQVLRSKLYFHLNFADTVKRQRSINWMKWSKHTRLYRRRRHRRIYFRA